MVADALDLNLPIPHAHVVARGIHGCWTSEHATIAQTETRAMPGTFHDVSLQRPFIKRATSMGTCRRNGIELQSLAQQDHRNARGMDSIEPVFLDAFHWQHYLIVLAFGLPGSMVHPGAFRKNHLTAQVRSVDDRYQAYETDDGSKRAIT